MDSMRLTVQSDFSLRVLIFVAAKRGALATIPEIAAAYDISRAHLMKVVHQLGKLGYLETVRGRSGGILLAKPASAIGIGAVLRATEESTLVPCFSRASAPGEPGCRIDGACRLKGMLAEALQAFFEALDRYTLADIVDGRAVPLRRLLQLA
jgi:Rrf2 family transcriptional regulator, nitric oxide-sensitive transcriptional repressor